MPRASSRASALVPPQGFAFVPPQGFASELVPPVAATSAAAAVASTLEPLSVASQVVSAFIIHARRRWAGVQREEALLRDSNDTQQPLLNEGPDKLSGVTCSAPDNVDGLIAPAIGGLGSMAGDTLPLTLCIFAVLGLLVIDLLGGCPAGLRTWLSTWLRPAADEPTGHTGDPPAKASKAEASTDPPSRKEELEVTLARDPARTHLS